MSEGATEALITGAWRQVQPFPKTGGDGGNEIQEKLDGRLPICHFLSNDPIRFSPLYSTPAPSLLPPSSRINRSASLGLATVRRAEPAT